LSLVVDASVLVAATSDAGCTGQWAEQLIASKILLAPQLALVEATNILRRLELAGVLERLEAACAVSDLLDLPIEFLPFPPFAARVWALRENITSYDAFYVAIAEQFELPLATLDRKLAHAPGPQCEFILPELSRTS